MSSIAFLKPDSVSEGATFTPHNFPTMSILGKPREVGHFSIDARRNIHLDKSQMKYLIPIQNTQNINWDLKINYGRDTVHNYIIAEKMVQMLHWMCLNKNSLFQWDATSSMNRLNMDFVTVRGTLKKIMCTPYAEAGRSDEWEICASKFNGSIYFNAIDTDADIAKERFKSDIQAMNQAWGYKFEQYMTTDTIGSKPDVMNAMHQMEEFCIVVKNVLNNNSLLYKAEVDATVPSQLSSCGSGETSCYTELKTAKIRTSSNHIAYFYRHAMLSWWAQSYLIGIPEVICGNKDDQGFIRSLDIFKVSEMPHLALGFWSPNVCLDFCNMFLNFLKKTVVEDDPSIVYKFQFNCCEKRVLCKKLRNPESRYRVIPQWFIEKVK